MAKRKQHHRRTNKGFTLLEVVIALMILGASLVTLLGLLSSIVQRTIRTKNEEQAMLAARSIFAGIESGVIETPTDAVDGTLPDILQRYNLVSKTTQADDQELSRYNVNITGASWGLPLFPDAMKKVSVSISWGDRSLDKITIDYYVPKSDQE